MADSAPSAASGPQPSSVPNAPPPRPPPNPAFRMLGMPAIPRKLPSRNWLIFWTLSAAVSAAIVYDKREKKRATARWAHAVEHLAREPLPDPRALPRKLTIFLSSPPGDGLRVAQDHFTEYVKPVLAASGLDWEFVQGRREGDVRAVVAERVRKARRGWEEKEEDKTKDGAESADKEDVVASVRRHNGTPPYEGILGDVVIGRHTWKEYIRGLHEGWLGPLTPPPYALPAAAEEERKDGDSKQSEDESKPKPPPPQPKPYNAPEDYPASTLPLLTPDQFSPSSPIPQPHILGFLNTPTRLRRFFNRRALADQIGREVAAVCLATYREYRVEPPSEGGGEPRYEQQEALAWEEKDWIKSIWREEEKGSQEGSSGTEEDGSTEASAARLAREKVWTRPVVMDARIATRMRRFELRPEDEERARAIVVPEEEVEGWVKGHLRQLYRWGANKIGGEQKKVPAVSEADLE
ncbi:hypothetical protein VTK73DRAFT_4246 [Phialemonium thermophilum]|uniref:Mitochondrial import inner membrane translocase subunit TIM54 n=1 Tax=Phialemonium thermophilum TaxID=223376 RepID=A0ABR3WUI2_9PEZI